MAMDKKIFTTPIIKANPITVLVLGICSALAVTVKLEPAIVMGISVTLVTGLSSFLISLIRKKDYIANPKPNGYRSLHLILGIPIFLSTGKKIMKVEVQFRTIAMDFWASLEHKLKYKHSIHNTEEISAKLKECADAITELDAKMQDIHNRIERENREAQESQE